ncbi:hypothetical protein AAE478_007222 [Parahypoxylon ruwenzoriense]
MAPPTILAHKSSFLTAQTLQLSQALAPSAAWRASNSHSQPSHDGEAAEGDKLPDRAVDEALYRVNHALQQHARRVYAPQASRHVAEQIEMLYHEAAERAVRGDSAGRSEEDNGEEDSIGREGREKGEKFSRVGADFASDDIIASLPATWDLYSSSQAESHPPEAHRYADLAASLTTLSARRSAACARLDRLRRMRGLLAPFASLPAPSGSANTATSSANNEETDDAGRNQVQPNLVTRDGEIEKELERMRVLLVRVAARVARLPDPRPGEDIVVEDLETVERGKIERLLDGI